MELAREQAPPRAMEHSGDQPRQFGGFLLFRESEANGYRTSYRAGVARGRTIDRVVRLEVFDGPDIDGSRMAATLEDAAQLQARVKDPHIARGVGIGDVAGVPYAAYDFELGTTLSAFLSVARDRSFPVPFDQALFIAERIALALAAARRVEHNGSPVLHSFVTPDAVLLSNEGGVKVLGFETGRALREQLATEAAYAAYLAPECRAGEAAANQDDVYSLGSILFELVSGEPYSAGESNLDELMVQATGEPASEDLGMLLEGSFAPRASRITNVLEWQQDLGRLILTGEYNPTTFNLAFLMHTIMRDRLEQDVQNLKQEKGFLLSRETESELAAETGSEVTGPASAGEEPTAVEETAEVSSENSWVEELAEPEQSTAAAGGAAPLEESLETPVDAVPDVAPDDDDSVGAQPFWIGFAASAIVGGIALAAFLILGSSSSQGVEPSQPLATPERPVEARRNTASTEAVAADPDPVAVAAPPAGSTDTLLLTEVVHGELEPPASTSDELERLVSERAQAIERDLKAEYEKKLEILRAEAEERQRQAAPDETTTTVPSPSADSEADSPVAANSVPERSPAEEVPGQVTPASASDVRTDADRPVGPGTTDDQPRATESAPPPGAERPPPAKPPAVTRPEPEIARTEPVEAAAAHSEPAEPAQPPKAVVKIAPKLLRLGSQTYPIQARRLGLSARVRVRVLVGINGKVKEAEIIGEKVGNGFDTAALTTVKRSRWQPATQAGEAVEGWTSVTIEFQP